MKKLTLLFVLMAISGCICGHPTNGSKVGTITSLADEGIICTTHEGTLVKGGLNGGSGTLGQSVSFNIQDEGVLELAKIAMESGKEVELHFHRPLIAGFCSRANAADVIVDSLKVVQ